MKILGYDKPIRQIREVVIPRDGGGIKLKICGYPIGVDRDFENVWPKPTPPFVIVLKREGGEKKEVKEYNYDDAAFRKAYDDWQTHRMLYRLLVCISVDENVQFNAQPTSELGIREMIKEIKDAGFSEGDIGVIFKAIQDVSNIDNKTVEEAKANF